jgi:hypothetical protein
MSDDSNHPADVSAADWVEQQEVADPRQGEEAAEATADQPNIDTVEADEADLAEQRVPVFFPDEDE